MAEQPIDQREDNQPPPLSLTTPSTPPLEAQRESVEGQALVEYSLIFVLIIIVCFSIVTTVSGTIDEKFFQVVKAMP